MDSVRFREELIRISSINDLRELAQRWVLHGTPKVFYERESEFFSFKQRICQKFAVAHTDVLIVGSAKLGFSPYKWTEFSLDSDIDLVIVSNELFYRIAGLAADLEYRIRAQDVFLRSRQWSDYQKFLRYLLIGWMRPDVLPRVDPCLIFKDEWFGFFSDISFGKSEVGNYNVSAAVFRSHRELEVYTVESVKKSRNSLLVGA